MFGTLASFSHMGGILSITLGIVSAMGGFVDIGELVFSVQAGVQFGFTLLWAVLVGTIGIILFSEMSGRVAAVTRRPVFTLVKQTMPRKMSFALLIASTLLNVLTCVAEMGGVAIAVQLLTGITTLPAILLTVAAFLLIVWLLPFKYLEKIFGLLGLFMIVFLVANIMLHTNIQNFWHGLLPTLPQGDTQSLLLYCYFAVGIISSAMMPYEVYFYSSGAIEEKWTPKDLLDNLFTTGIGMSLGGVLSASLLMLGSKLFSPLGINPQLHGTSVLLASIPFGKPGMYLGLLGIIFAIGGAAIETCFAGAYNIAQYFDWRWGRHLAPEKTPKFTKSWIVIFVLTLFVLLLGIDPIQMVEYAVIFSIVVLPFTYYSVFRVAANKNILGKHANTFFVNALGWIFFVIVAVIALAAIPLMILTNMGQG